jgi:hypothetical protein
VLRAGTQLASVGVSSDKLEAVMTALSSTVATAVMSSVIAATDGVTSASGGERH